MCTTSSGPSRSEAASGAFEKKKRSTCEASQGRVSWRPVPSPSPVAMVTPYARATTTPGPRGRKHVDCRLSTPSCRRSCSRTDFLLLSWVGLALCTLSSCLAVKSRVLREVRCPAAESSFESIHRAVRPLISHGKLINVRSPGRISPRISLSNPQFNYRMQLDHLQVFCCVTCCFRSVRCGGKKRETFT